MNTPVNIFYYVDPILYLNDKFKEKRTKNSSFSIRSWAKALGLKEPTTLSLILKGKRALPLHYLPLLTPSLGLNLLEEKHLEAIIKLSSASTAQEKELWTRRVQEVFHEATFSTDWVQDFEMFKNTIPMILLELVGLNDFILDPKWIQSRLIPVVSEEEIIATFDKLIERKFLALLDNGKLVRTKKHVTSGHDIASIWIKKFHETSLNQAISGLYQQQLDEREFGSSILSIKKSDLKEMKKMMRDFNERFISRFSMDNGNGDAVYHFNINLFAQTNEGTIE